MEPDNKYTSKYLRFTLTHRNGQFGFGLSYTSFSYSDINSINKK